MAHDHRGRQIADPHMHVVEAMRSRARQGRGNRAVALDTGREGYIDPEDMHGFSFVDDAGRMDNEDYVNDPYDDEDYSR
jgi:hypothetical protein